MPRTSFDALNCSIARSLDALGDGWTLMIIRDAFFGVRRFADFERGLGISKNVLAARLRHLVEHEILERVDEGVHGERYEYRLTDKGRDLYPVIATLLRWGDRWMAEDGPPTEFRHRGCGHRFTPVLTCKSCGDEVTARDLRITGRTAARAH